MLSACLDDQVSRGSEGFGDPGSRERTQYNAIFFNRSGIFKGCLGKKSLSPKFTLEKECSRCQTDAKEVSQFHGSSGWSFKSTKKRVVSFGMLFP